MPTTLSIIGFGSMGSAILRGAVEAGVLEAESVLVIEPDDGRREQARRLGCVVSAEARFAWDSPHVLLAVKPQVFASVAEQMGPAPAASDGVIVTSIMAGLSSAAIRQVLGGNTRIIRAMPNTPCRVKAGMTALAIGEGARSGDEHFPVMLFASMGRVVKVEEHLLHAVTAVSGSGPAYVFLLAESMEQAGIQAGLDHHTARTLAYQTILGAGRMLTADGDGSHAPVSADALRTQVTSPGGTTAAALEVFFEAEFPQIVAEAILAARDRAVELGR
ncbi:MAG: pyrroline-5-carboxylate reductase [Phycisphaeraceae bacterium]|nr:pyrroline-5-carboxylate reductase [Phycisphaerales bacterium]QOJ18547.1 MAG: pyrroline-5-carboxylate reductase [Phycisphaeraceae bacterium]